MDKDGAVGLCIAGKVFLPGGLLGDLAVFPEHFDLFAVVRPEVIVWGLPTDRAANARLSVLAEEKDNLVIEIPPFLCNTRQPSRCFARPGKSNPKGGQAVSGSTLAHLRKAHP